MEPIKLSYNEVKAIINFLKNQSNDTNLSKYETFTIYNLYLAYIKLQKAEEQWKETMEYTE